MNEVFALGTPIRWFPDGRDGVGLLLQVGGERVEIVDELAAVLWRHCGGEPTFRADGGFGREELVALMADRYGSDGGDAERDAVYAGIDELIRRGAAIELDTSDMSDPVRTQEVASSLALHGLGGVIGADPRNAGVFRLGVNGIVELPVTRHGLEVFIRSDGCASLWALALHLAADPSGHGDRGDVDWTSPYAQLPFVYLEIRRMLWHGLAYLDRT